MSASLRFKTRPERVFISVDESTGRSTVSFVPTSCSDPVQYEDDKTGARALRAVNESCPGVSVSGPHFHAARPPRARPRRGRPGAPAK